MSFILNSLRKSEQERQDRQPETLENRILEKQDIVQKKTPVWLIVLVIINMFFLIFFIWSFTKEDINEGIGEKAVVAEKSATNEEKKIKTLPVQAIKPPIKPILKTQISIAEQLKVKQAGNDKKDKPEPPKGSLASNDKKEKPEQHSLQRVEPAKEVVTTTALVEEPILEKVAENTSREIKLENLPPFLSELDYDFRRRVPDININVFVYSENKEDRFIMIDMKKYLTGQQIYQGMTLKEIRMDSLVVEYKNKVFQIQRN